MNWRSRGVSGRMGSYATYVEKGSCDSDEWDKLEVLGLMFPSGQREASGVVDCLTRFMPWLASGIVSTALAAQGAAYLTRAFRPYLWREWKAISMV